MFRRAFANHYMSAESFLPWTNDNRLDVKPEEDMRDVVMVAGVDPCVVHGPGMPATPRLWLGCIQCRLCVLLTQLRIHVARP